MFQQLGLAVLLGLLVGLQREHAASGIAGMRTFPLITVLGCLSAMLAAHFGDSWIIAAALAGVVAVTVVGHLLRGSQEASDDDPHPGTTTDMAMLLMFVVGVMIVVGPIPVAVIVGGGVAVLLQFKPELHGIVKKLGDTDLRAIMQFVLITCIILPLLPNHNYDPTSLFQQHIPLDVLNPRQIWLMVVLIVGLSLGGYISYKFFGRNAGTLLGGVLGGAVSSTATTVSYARSARRDSSGAQTAAIVIMIASTVMYIRVLLAVAVVSPMFMRTVLLPVAVLMFLTLLPAIVLWYRSRNVPAPMPEQQNPTQMTSAIVFGILYATMLLALAAAKYYWSDRGLYAVAFLSGLTEMDAITLSTARMASTDTWIADDGWRLIVVAAMANVVSKTTLAGLLGGRRLFGRLVLWFAIPMIGGAVLLALL